MNFVNFLTIFQCAQFDYCNALLLLQLYNDGVSSGQLCGVEDDASTACTQDRRRRSGSVCLSLRLSSSVS